MAHPERPHLHLVHEPSERGSRIEQKLQHAGEHLLATAHEHMSRVAPDERRNFYAKDSIVRLGDGTEIYTITNEPRRDDAYAPRPSVGFYVYNGWGTRRLTIHVERAQLRIEEVSVPEGKEWNTCIDQLMDLDWDAGIHQISRLPSEIKLQLPPSPDERHTLRTAKWTTRQLARQKPFKDRMLRALGLDA